MSFAAMLPRALIASLGSDRSYRQREPAALVLTAAAAAGAGRGQLGVRQALLPSPRLLGIPGTSNQAMRDHGAARSSGSWSLGRSGDAGAAMRRQVANRKLSLKPKSVAQMPRLRGPQETARHQPAQQSQPPRRLDRPRQTRRHPGPPRVGSPELVASPLMKRPYDLRHSGITWRLDSGVPDAEVAMRAGHSVEMLRRVYAGRVQGLEGIWITRMTQTLPQDQP